MPTYVGIIFALHVVAAQKVPSREVNVPGKVWPSRVKPGTWEYEFL